MNNEESMLIFASNLRSPGLHDDVIEVLHLRPGTWDLGLPALNGTGPGTLCRSTQGAMHDGWWNTGIA